MVSSLAAVQSALRWLLFRCENPACPHGARNWSLSLGQAGRFTFLGKQHCGLECFEAAAESEFRALLRSPFVPRTAPHRLPLGLLLLERGLISEADLKKVLQAQREAGRGRIGEWLREVLQVDEEKITAALGAQWACPVYPLDRKKGFFDCADLLPVPLLAASRMIPVHYARPKRYLFLGFSNGVDYPALYAVEQMLDCRAEACAAAESGVSQALEELRAQRRPLETVFDDVREPREMARIARNYADQLRARQARVVHTGTFLWMRFDPERQPSNLLFRVSK